MPGHAPTHADGRLLPTLVSTLTTLSRPVRWSPWSPSWIVTGPATGAASSATGGPSPRRGTGSSPTPAGSPPWPGAGNWACTPCPFLPSPTTPRHNTAMPKHAPTTGTSRTADVIALATVQTVACVLLGRRAHAPYAGYWAFPGGHVGPGESALAAVVRELDEETGL